MGLALCRQSGIAFAGQLRDERFFLSDQYQYLRRALGFSVAGQGRIGSTGRDGDDVEAEICLRHCWATLFGLSGWWCADRASIGGFVDGAGSSQGGSPQSFFWRG